MKKVRMAVVGTGNLAQKQHIPNAFKTDNIELVALCDLNHDILKKLGKEYGVGRLETDYKKIFSDPSIDGVIIVTREDTHVPLTIEALKSGKHVYVEKPLAETEEECKKVVREQKVSGKIVAVGMNRRMSPAYRWAKELLWKKGGPRNMFYRIADAYSILWGKHLGIGSRVIHEGCHIFDILRFFAESEVKSVYCVASRPDDEIITLQFESGCVATIMSSGYVNSDMPKEHFEAIAETGGLTVEDFSEAKQFSLDNNAPCVKTFAGHTHPMHDLLHEYLINELGAQAMEAIRRVSLDCTERLCELEKSQDTSGAEYRKLKAFEKQMPLCNYFMNKGWKEAIEDFANAIIEGRNFAGASAFDGFQASRITSAAIKSRKTGELTIL